MQPEEAGLPALAQLTDAEAARTLLERSIHAGSTAYPQFRLHGCRPQIMRYKPGSRCTILYHLAYGANAEPGPPLVVAKTYHRFQGANAYQGMRALRMSLGPEQNGRDC